MSQKTTHTIIFYLAFLTLILPVTLRKIHSNDVAKSLYTGRYIAQKLEFPRHSAFAFSDVKKEILPRHSFNWLGNLFFYGLYQLSGFVGLQLFRLLLILGCFILLHSMTDFELTPLVLLLLVAGVFGLMQKFLIRNALFFIPGLVLLLWLWFQARIRRRRNWIWGVPVLLTIWGNIHGSYLAGLAIFGLLFVGDVLDYWWQPKLRLGKSWYFILLLVFVLSLLCVTFVKPLAPDYKAVKVISRGWNIGEGGLLAGKSRVTDVPEDRGWGEDIKRMLQSTAFGGVYNSDIRAVEFKFPLEEPDSLYITVSLALIIITLLVFVFTPFELRFSLFLPFIFASIVGLGYLRTVAFIPLVSLPVLFLKHRRGDFDRLRGSSLIKITAIIVLVFWGANMGYRVYDNSMDSFTGLFFQEYGFGLHARYSSEVPEYVLENYPDEPMYNSYNLGSWLIWKWWPKKKVFIDSKSSGYTKQFVKNYHNKSIKWIMEKYDFKHLIIQLRETMVAYIMIAHPNWRVEAFDSGMILLEYKSSEEAMKDNGNILAKFLLSAQEYRRLSPNAKLFIKAIVEAANNRELLRREILKKLNHDRNSVTQ